MAITGWSRDSILAARKQGQTTNKTLGSSSSSSPNKSNSTSSPSKSSSSNSKSSSSGNLTQYSNDYQAEINRRTAINPNDPSIAELQRLRQQKIAETNGYGSPSYQVSDYSSGSIVPDWQNDQLPSEITASDYYKQQYEEQQKAIQARIDAAVSANNAYIPQINDQSESALRAAYIANQQARVQTPQILNAMGASGGMSESSLIGLDSSYQNARASIEKSRDQSLSDIAQNEAQIRSTGDATLSDAAASYYGNLVHAAKEAQAQQLAAQQAAQAQSNWEAEFAANQKKYSDAAAQQAWQNAYDEKVLALQQASKSAANSSGGGSAGLTYQQLVDAANNSGTKATTSSGITQSIGAVAQGLSPANYSYKDVYNSIVPNRTPEGVRQAAQTLLAKGANPSYVEQALKALGYQ